MGKKGKDVRAYEGVAGTGRGRGRGASGSDAPGSEEQRPGPSGDSSRGRGRGRGQLQPQQQAPRQTEDTRPASEAPPPEQRTPAPRTTVPKFFESTAASSSTPEPAVKTLEKAAGDSQPTQRKEAGLAESGQSGQDIPSKKKLDKSEQEELLTKFTGISLEHKEPAKYPFAKRPNYPLINETNRIPLFVNYFKLSFKNVVIYHYDIDISDSTKDKKIGRSVMSEGRTFKEDIKQKVKHVERQQRRNMGKDKCRQIIARVFKTTEALRQFCPVYDGQKNLFTSKPLPCKKGAQFPVDITLEGKEKRFFVTISPVVKDDSTNIISLEPLKALYEKRSKEIPYEVLLVYETVMSHREPPFTQVNFRNSFFDLESRDKSYLGCGLEIWRGYHQAVQLTEVCPVVVINLAAKAFHKAGSLLDYACDVLNTDITRLPKLNPYQIKNLTSALKGLQVKVTHQRFPRKYKIKNVTDLAAKDIIVEIEKRKISVPQYFQEKYQRKLKFPQLPCLLMQTSGTTHMPMETCEVVEGQPKVGKLSGELTSQMIRSTAVEPKKRKEIVKDTAARVNALSKDFMNSFGLLMDIKLMQVDGRMLAAPQLMYDKSLTVKPDNRGVWRVEGAMKFVKQVIIKNWVLISFADERRFGYEVLNNYCQFLVKSGRKCGISIDRPQSVNIYDRNMRTETAIQRAKSSGAEMAIVVLNRRDNYHTYDEVKFLADFKHNLVTQCMEDKTLGRINDQITTNVCLKINVKLGGVNHVLHQKLQIFDRPAIVLGIDAIHWTRGFGYPSILAIVGSLNPTATRYALTCDLQRNDREGKISQEIIRDMREISKVVLKKFREVNGLDPKRIVVFRDGVSEGQFQHALDYEVSGLQEACQDLYQTYLPITYMVVQKRHQTRFFPARASDGVGRMQNIPPGTCVDRDVTHPVYFDYFICSHEGIQGTSKPAKYTVLHDDLHLKSEQLQQLCYFLCHTYVRCTRSVSLPAPVMYADLVAARAKKYADHRLLSTAETASMADSDCSHRDLPPDVERAIREMQSFDNNMFYV